MLTISRRLVRSLRTVFGRAGEGLRRPRSPQVSFSAGKNGVRIQHRAEEFGVEYRISDPQPEESFTIGGEVLREFESNKDRPVTLRRNNKLVLAEWDDQGIPQRNEYDIVDERRVKLLTAPPELVQIGDGAVLGCLADLARSCTSETTRYALNCIQLRGAHGDAIATDGRELLLIAGFTWPWKEELLIVSSRLFGSQEFVPTDPVCVGKTDKHVVLRTGAWTLWLPIAKDVRFPKLEHVLSDPEKCLTRVSLSTEDARFLDVSIPRLPHSVDDDQPLTLHVNGQAVIRARGKSGPITELVLSNTTTTGPELCLKVGRNILRRALQLGQREFCFGDVNVPVLCPNGPRLFVFQPLGNERVLKVTPDAIRICSPTAASSKSPITEERSTISMKSTSSPVIQLAPSQATSAAAFSKDVPSDPIAAAQALKVRIREALTDTSGLIVSLKRERRKNQALRSTLASLRELQKVA